MPYVEKENYVRRKDAFLQSPQPHPPQDSTRIGQDATGKNTFPTTTAFSSVGHIRLCQDKKPENVSYRV